MHEDACPTGPVIAGARPVRRKRHGGQDAGRVLATRVGLRFPDLLSYPDWETAGHQISRIVDSSAWCLGDWILFGQSRFRDRYRQAVEAANLDYQTIRNYAWVARAFEMSRRRDTLSFQHHAEVASMPPEQQDRWLDLAESGGWSRNQLRAEIRRDRGGDLGPAGLSDKLPSLPLDGKRLTLWRTAAELANNSLEEWIVASLDTAATSVVQESRPRV